MALRKWRTQWVQTRSKMQSEVPAAAKCHSRSQDPGLGRFSIGFTLIFWVLFLDFAKAFTIQLHFCPSYQFSGCRIRERKPQIHNVPGGRQGARLETHWLRLVELNCCQQQREVSPEWSQVYRIPQGAILFLLSVLKNRWIWHVYCRKLSCFISTSDLGTWQMCQTENNMHPCPELCILASVFSILNCSLYCPT